LKTNKLSLDKVTKIVEMTNKGEFRTTIAKELSISTSTVYKYQKKFGLI